MKSDRKQQDILFLEKVFLKKRKPSPLRGVELFNIGLVHDLLDQGLSVTLPADETWRQTMEDALPASRPAFVWTKGLGIDFIDAFIAALKLRRRTFDTLILANVGNSLLPALRLLRPGRSFTRCVLIAHRVATSRFVRAVKSMPGHVLAVNGIIAEPFREAGHPSVHVDYGVMKGELFSPSGEERADTTVRFCVLGMLDNAWKGADTAVSAFRSLPPDVQAHSELHLYSFTTPPTFPEPGIHAHGWIDPSAIPDVLRSMDVMIVPSRDEVAMRETFSQAVVQGMLTGLPVIVSDRPILAEKLDHGGGMVFHSERELVRSMVHLAGDAEARLNFGQQGRQTALERYVWDTSRFVERYMPPPSGRDI